MTSTPPEKPQPRKPEQGFSVIHIISEPTIRGGENQIRHLITASKDKFPEVHHQVLCIEGSAALEVFKPLCPVTTYSGFISGIIALRRLSRVTDHGQVIIDAHSSKGHSLGYAARLIGLSKAPFVVHRRVDFRPKSKGKYKSAHIDRYVAISDFIAKVLVNFGIGEDKVSTVKSAVSDAPFKSLNRAEVRRNLRKEWLGDLPPDTPIMINVGFLTEQKDHATLIRAVARLAPLLAPKSMSMPGDTPFLCVIAGSGHLEGALREQIAEAKLEGKVKLLGLRKDVPACLAASDIFVMSSAYEGLGTSILDAMHSHLPVAATAVGGIPEMVIDAETGLLSPPGDSEALASNLARLIQDEALRNTLAESAAKTVLPKFTVDAMVEGNIAVYRELLGQG